MGASADMTDDFWAKAYYWQMSMTVLWAVVGFIASILFHFTMTPNERRWWIIPVGSFAGLVAGIFWPLTTLLVAIILELG